VCVCIYVRLYIYIGVYAFMYVCHVKDVCTHRGIFICIHPADDCTEKKSESCPTCEGVVFVRWKGQEAYIYVYLCVCIFTHIHMYRYMHIYIYI